MKRGKRCKIYRESSYDGHGRHNNRYTYKMVNNAFDSGTCAQIV